jgi:hypothetical protein
MEQGRTIWAARELLDRQIVDCNDTPTAKVDDLEFEFSAEPGSLPIATAILCGPAALARRFGGRLGSAIETMHALVDQRRQPRPASIPFGLVKEITSAVSLTVAYKDLPVTVVEEWLSEHVIANIPGNGKDTGPSK